MSISIRVTEAFKKMLQNDPEGAAYQICSAIEETSRREGRTKGKKGYKAFIADNVMIILGIGIGIPIIGLRFGYPLPDLKTSADGTVGIEDIIYHIIRCGLYHTGSLPNTLQFSDNELGDVHKGGRLLLPKNLVNGLIMAVIASPANKLEKTSPGYYFSVKHHKLYLNKFWGKRDELIPYLLTICK